MLIFNGKKFRAFWADDRGAIAFIFALCMPAFVGAAGIAVDIAQAYNVKNRLGNALDKAALAAGSTAGTEAEVRQRAIDFFNANYPDDKIGQSLSIEVELTDDSVEVEAIARVDTTFMSMMGIEYIDVRETSGVMREVRGLEVAMVLDNTGSMSTNNNISAVRTASNNFIGILFDAAADPNDIKIAMVPYSSAVRIGRYGLGLNPNGSAYSDGSVFVRLPSGVSYTTNKNSSTGWYGCVIEHRSTNFSAAATHVTNSYGQLWRTATQCSTASNCRGHGWDGNSGSNDPSPNDIPDNFAGPWDIYMSGTLTRNCSGTCNPKYTFNRASHPNENCPNANVMPLTSNESALLANVSTMTAEGATLSNVGMAWGYRMLSPDPPFIEGSDWGDENWRKALMIMTDGETSMGGNYTAYWFTNQNNIDNDDLDDRMAEVCDDLKARGVTIYTVTFAAGVPASTKQAYEDCATSSDHYFDAPSQASLIESFEEIARQLSNLRVTH